MRRFAVGGPASGTSPLHGALRAVTCDELRLWRGDQGAGEFYCPQITLICTEESSFFCVFLWNLWVKTYAFRRSGRLFVVVVAVAAVIAIATIAAVAAVCSSIGA